MRLVVWVTALAGCNGPFAECAGTLLGTYQDAGGTNGTVSASLSDDGDLQISLVDPDGELVGTATVPVDENGDISTPDGQAVQVDGSMDLESCLASGDWAALGGNGTWEIAP